IRGFRNRGLAHGFTLQMPSRFLMAIRAACFTGRSAAPLTANALILAEHRFVVESFPSFWPELLASNRTGQDTFGRRRMGESLIGLRVRRRKFPCAAFLFSFCRAC